MLEGAPLVMRTGLSVVLTGDDKAISAKLGATKLKQLSAQPAMHAVSSAVFCVSPVGTLWRWSQSAIVREAEISIAVVAPAAKPVAAGNVATDKPIRAARMARPMRRIMFNFATTINRAFAAFHMYRSKWMVHALIFIKCYFGGAASKNRINI